MLEIKNITKVYTTNGLKSKALDKVSVNFRTCEFASILGPSGSGKTTFLNIIGGLDHYTSGDILVNTISTKKYKNKDWDSYRNHRIGFVFQSYNLIPHQTVLKNVQLALTLSGIKKREGAKRAKKALEEVGLKEHINKRPNQLSGGQMQRVAIARALVNDPDILLADEPTGALDSETSIQIMDLLKKISERKLVIMVTHNPDLAKEYSTRIITLKDGKITDDSDPYDGKDDFKDSQENVQKKTKKTKMSLFTSFGLSFNNLMTKKARTLLVSVAGSIGIIGIALILAVSNGFQRYIDDIENETMTSYPLTIMSETSDITSLLLSMSGETTDSPSENDLKETQIVTNLIDSLSTNDLTSFKKYLDENPNLYEKDVKDLVYNYNVDPLIYTRLQNGELRKLNPSSLFSSLYGSSSAMSSYSSFATVFQQLPTENREELDKKYKILAGHLPENYDEIIVVLNDENSISDFLLYSLGFRDPEELTAIMTKIMSGETVEINNVPMSLSYNDLLNTELKLVEPTNFYQYNPEYNIYENLSENNAFLENLYDQSTSLKIVGIVTSNNDSGLSLSRSGIYYTKDLIKKIINNASTTEIVKSQIKNPDIDVFSGKRFDEKSDSLGLDFKDFVAVDEEKLKDAFNISVDKTEIESKVSSYISEIQSNLKIDTTPGKTAFAETLETIFADFIENLPTEISISDQESLVNSYLSTYFPNEKISNLTKEYVLPTESFKSTFSGLLSSFLSTYVSTTSTAYSKIPDFNVLHPELFDGGNLIKVLRDDAALSSIQTIFLASAPVEVLKDQFASAMTEAKLNKTVLTSVGNLTSYLTESFASAFNVNPESIASAFKLNVTEEEITRIVSAMLTKTEATKVSNLITLGYQDLNSPTSIYIYFDNFDGKEHFLNLIDEYNSSVSEESKIKYTDTTSILTNSIKTIVDAVTYVLIAFVSISLVVSSIMIGVITYISVYERTKEIGVLRALGASKRDISSIFNAETFIIGLLSGLVAMLFSYIIIPIINAILLSLTGVENLSAYLGLDNAAILIILSVILTLIGGLIPAKSASKKDPVEALRTE